MKRRAITAALLLSSWLAPAWSAVELVGQPARAKNILGAIAVTDPTSGKDIIVLSNNNEASNGALLFLDPETNNTTTVSAPTGAGAEAMMEVDRKSVV